MTSTVPVTHYPIDPALTTNLREAYQAIKFPTHQPLPLVANFFGTRIYDSRYGWGRLWRFFYQITEWATHHDYHLEKLKKAVITTHNIFLRERSTAEKSLHNYIEYLKKTGKGYNIPEANYFPSRLFLSEWNVATKPFLKLLQKPLFESNAQEILQLDTTTSFNFPLATSIQSYQKIIDLEGLLGGPLPLVTLKKVIREIPLNLIEQKDLDKWISKINKANLEAKTIHKALKAVISVYAKKHLGSEDPQIGLAKLELFLEDKGCQVFQKNDQKHILWRQHLVKGEKLFLNHSEVILGDEIFPQKTGSDQTRAYTIEGQPHAIALIAQNCTALSIRNQRLQKEPLFDITPALIHDISSDGRIAVIEKLQPLNTVQWSSDNHITHTDKPILKMLEKLIHRLIKHNITPPNFSLSYLMFNEELQLRLLKPAKNGPFNFNAIEDFILESANGNLLIYQELMTESGLINHPITKYYRDAVSHTLKNDLMPLDDLAGIYKISDPHVVDRAKSLAQQLITLKKKLQLSLRPSFPNFSSQELDAKINQTIQKTYTNYKTAGILWPTAFDTFK